MWKAKLHDCVYILWDIGYMIPHQQHEPLTVKLVLLSFILQIYITTLHLKVYKMSMVVFEKTLLKLLRHCKVFSHDHFVAPEYHTPNRLSNITAGLGSIWCVYLYTQGMRIDSQVLLQMLKYPGAIDIGKIWVKFNDTKPWQNSTKHRLCAHLLAGVVRQSKQHFPQSATYLRCVTPNFSSTTKSQQRWEFCFRYMYSSIYVNTLRPSDAYMRL